jgi:hypothetical protein
MTGWTASRIPISETLSSLEVKYALKKGLYTPAATQ